MKRRILLLGIFFSVSGVAGCGQMQSYNQWIDGRQQAFNRQQMLLDEQNTIEVNKYKAQQREQEIQAARAEGAKAQAQAAGEAQAAIEKARGEAEANRLLSASLTPALVRYHMIDALARAGTIYYLPSNMIISNLVDPLAKAAVGEPSPVPSP